MVAAAVAEAGAVNPPKSAESTTLIFVPLELYDDPRRVETVPAPSTDSDVLVVNLCNKSALAENGAAIKSITIGKNFFML